MLNKIFNWLDSHRDELISYLGELVSIPSVSQRMDSEETPYGAECRRVLDRFLSDGERFGFETQNCRNRVGRVTMTGGEGRGIGVWCHLDVVPPMDGWDSDPFTVVEKDGLLFGRGVLDDKGAAAGVMFILRAFRELGVEFRCPVSLFVGTDEEQGMSDVEDYVNHFPLPDFNLVPDADFPGIRGEAGRMIFCLTPKAKLSDDIVRIEGGTVHNIIPKYATCEIKKTDSLDLSALENVTVRDTGDTVIISALGKPSHVAQPEGSVNAIYVLTSALEKLGGISDGDRAIFRALSQVNSSYYGDGLGIQGEDELCGKTVCSGTVLTMEDGRPILLCDSRFNLSDNTQRLTAIIENWTAENGFTVDFDERKEPFLNTDEERLNVLLEAYKKATGAENADFVVIKGGTYAGMLPNAIATGVVDETVCDVTKLLPEGQGGCHQPNEAVSVEAYMRGMKILAAMLYRLR